MPDEKNDSLSIPVKFTVGRKVGFAARRDEVRKQMDAIDPSTCRNRIVIEIDDSGSMGREGMEQAHRAIDAFLSSCNPLDTSISLYPMNKDSLSLTNDYSTVRSTANEIWATGGTPLYSVAQKALEGEALTRLIIFSDGSPTDNYGGYGDVEMNSEKTIRMAIEKKISIDTVGIGHGEFLPLQNLSEKTNGIFLKFTGPEVFAKQMKYLAPAHRAALANPEIKAKIERGEQI